MIRSSEIESLVLQWYKDISSGENLAAHARRFYSSQEGMVAIGTDPKEWVEGIESVLSASEEMEGMGKIEVKSGNLKAYSEGTVGWASDSSTLIMPDGSEVPVRQTFVFHKENEEWKVVQLHASIGVSNEELV